MRILHVISQPPDFTGSGKFIQQVIFHARVRGHENCLVAGCQGGYLLPERLMPADRAVLIRFDGRDLNFPVAGMSDAMPYDSTVFSRMSPDAVAAYKKVFREKIEEALNRFRPELIHSHHLWIVSALARALAPDLPVVVSCHGTCLRQHQFCEDISRGITQDLCAVDRVMALSRDQQAIITERFGLPKDRVPVIPGGFDETVFIPGTLPDSGVAQILYAGKLSRAKGVPWLLKSLDRIRDLPFRLHIAGGGGGTEKASCLDLIRNLGEKAVYHGTLSHRELAALMGRSHLFVLPSFYEGVPLVLMEALACGCRILCTDLPGARAILHGPDQDLIHFFPLPPLETLDRPYKRDEPVLEDRLSGMLKTVISKILESPVPDRELARKKTEPFTWSKVYDRIDRVYRDVAGR